MENRLDQLFRDKLAGHKEAPTENAWAEIHHQLSAKRRKTWMKRLSVAASILLFISAGYIAFQYVKQTVSISPVVTQHEHVEKPATPDNTDTQKATEENSSVISDLKEAVNIENQRKAPTKNKCVKDSNAQAPQEHAAHLADKELTKTPENKPDVVAKEKSELPEPSKEALPASQTESQLALNDGKDGIENESPSSTESDKKTDHSPVIADDYPRITVIYKASQNSELIAKKETGILNKGIKKISRFSDEHIVTEELKTKLRNTTEDLLALNFGKMINRSNKDLENQ